MAGATGRALHLQVQAELVLVLLLMVLMVLLVSLVLGARQKASATTDANLRK